MFPQSLREYSQETFLEQHLSILSNTSLKEMCGKNSETLKIVSLPTLLEHILEAYLSTQYF